MNQTISRCLVSAACLAVTALSPAQSAVRGGGVARSQDPAPSRERIQVRLAEVISMLEEEDLSPEQREMARKKLQEIMERLRKEQAQGQGEGGARGMGGGSPIEVSGAKVAEPGSRIRGRVVRVQSGDGRVVEVQGREGHEVEVFEIAPEADARPRMNLLGATEAAEAPAAPKPPKAPKAEKPPKAPKPPQAPTRISLSTPAEPAQVAEEHEMRALLQVEREMDIARAAERRVARGRDEASRARHDALIELQRAHLAEAEARDRAAASEPRSRVGQRAKRVVEVEDDDAEIRAMIDEMRAEMREIRALMQQIRSRSQEARDEAMEPASGDAPLRVRALGGR